MTFRRAILLSHRWLGLGSSMVLAVVGVSGAIIVWPSQSLIRRVAGPVHERLAFGRIGWWIVVIATVVAVFLLLGGVFLWWRRKVMKIRTGAGWKQGLADVHHAAGIVAFPAMFVLAASGVAMSFVTPFNFPELRKVIFALHTSRGFSIPVKVLYTIATTGFLIQGVSGVVMWWSRKRPGPTTPR